MRVFFLALLIPLTMASCKQRKKSNDYEKTSKYPTIGTIERLDSSLDKLISPDAVIEVIGEGLTWSEGPLWIPGKKWVLCSDVAENKIYKWSEENGLEVYLEKSGFTGESTDSREQGSNGLTLDAEGNLILCQHGDRRVARMNTSLENPSSGFTTMADSYQGKRLNSPNDLTFDSQGNLYFTDPPFGLSEAMMEDPKKELSFQGVFRLSKDGLLTLLTDELSRPNGLALSPNEKTLYVANADGERAIWMAYPLNEDGTLGKGKVLYDATPLVGKEPGFPDGIKVDRHGNVWTAGPGGLWIFDASGKVLGKIKTGEWVSNCNFDEKQETIYLTADDYLMRVKLRP